MALGEDNGREASSGGDVLQEAGQLAERLGLPLIRGGDDSSYTLLLARTPTRLELREAGPLAAGPVAAEFLAGRGSPLLRRATLAGKEDVARVIDATAGLGTDGFAIAEAGCQVELIERSEIVAALLADGIERARQDPLCREAAERMRLHMGDATELLPSLAPADVVYLDPMYPRSGREGGKAKEMRVLRVLLGDDGDAGGMLEVARLATTRRVVVKRPLRASHLAGVKPSGTLSGTTIRYDLYGPLGTAAGEQQEGME